MAYTPPGVYTEIEIANNIVSLPGGTRVLAIIGMGRNYKCVSGESVVQTSSRTETLAHTSTKSVSNVYDFTSAGGGLRYYPAASSTTYGDGYTVTSGVISWSVATNPYPTSTTPASGTGYLASYSYSGTTNTGTTFLTPLSSGYYIANTGTSGTVAGLAFAIPTISAVDSVWDGVNIATAAQFSGTGIGLGGSGYWLSGTTLLWTNGALGNFLSGVTSGSLPASGASYYVKYSYTGTVSAQSFTQGSTYSNLIIASGNLTSGLTTVSAGTVLVSGSSVSSYPASGTATNPDTSGYSTSGSGWSVTGTAPTQYISWSPVIPASYAYPSTTVAPVDGIYYVDYCYYKSGSDYNPKFFTDYTQVVNEYGPEAEWSLIASGTNAGKYQFVSLNTLTLAARLAFANNASIISLTQISGTDFTNNAVFQSPLNKLQNKLVDIIVPITAGSGSTTTEMTVAEKSALLLDVETHCDTMSLPQNKKERVAIGSLGVAEIGNTTDANTYVYTANSIKNKRITITAPGITTVEIQDPNGEFQNVDVEGSFMSVGMAALSCNPNSDVATPLTNKNLSNFASTSAVTADHEDPEYLESEKNILAAGGICVIDRAGSRIFIRHQLTTNQTNVAEGEFSVVTTTDYVSQAVRFTTEQFIGRKLVSAIVVPAVRATIQATMQALTDSQLINSVGAITVTVNPNNPTEILSTVQYVPIFPLNRIRVTFTIRTAI